jgi:hypothetical protein
MTTKIQCEECGEIPITGDCPHGCDERQPKAWRNGRYIYCLSHSDFQVYDSQTIYKGDPLMWRGRRCDWCKKEIK